MAGHVIHGRPGGSAERRPRQGGWVSQLPNAPPPASARKGRRVQSARDGRPMGSARLVDLAAHGDSKPRRCQRVASPTQGQPRRDARRSVFGHHASSRGGPGKRRWTVQTDHQPRFSHVLTRESSHQRAQLFGQCDPITHQARMILRLTHKDQIHVAERVHRVLGVGAGCGNADDSALARPRSAPSGNGDAPAVVSRPSQPGSVESTNAID